MKLLSAIKFRKSTTAHGVCVAVFLTAVFIQNVSCQEGAINLGPQNIHRDRITLSGFTSGGTFAQQLQISHSTLIKGIAVFSHAYYRCGPGDGLFDNYDNACTIIGPLGPTSPKWNPSLAIADIVNYHAAGLIDDPLNLRNKPLYVYAGTKSDLFSLETSMGILTVYEPFIRNASAIRTRIQNGNMVLPTINTGGLCTQSARDNLFAARCGFNGAYDALNFILGGGLKEPKKNKAADISRLASYDQSEFFKGVPGNGPHAMDTEGYIYIPKNCNGKKKCLLHMFFHGCFAGREFNGTTHVENSGYLQVAEANDIIMVFPQAVSAAPQNEFGCWDTFGVTGPLYATKRGAQVTVVKNIIDRLLGEDEKDESRQQRPPTRPQDSDERVSRFL